MRYAVALPLLLAAAASAHAQVRTVDPNAALQGRLAPDNRAGAPVRDDPLPSPADDPEIAAPMRDDVSPPSARASGSQSAAPARGTGADAATATTDAQDKFQDDDLFTAAEGVFGKGAQGLAKLLEGVLKKQGRPNAYIAGREAGAAFVFGLRYGSGVMHHKVEGEREVHWTGPSLGFDAGGNGAKTFILVYNLYDTQDLYRRRFPAVEGSAYAVGGLTASYLRRGDVVLIPIRLGVGWRIGANLGYMKFTEKTQLQPF